MVQPIYNREKITNVAKRRFGADFEFRPGQVETIEDILSAYHSGATNMYFLEAPTGSGKSLIAMIAAAVLEEDGKQGYILTSDITLQKQYENDFTKYKLKWGTVYGGDNYKCAVNDQSFFLGDCQIRGIGYEAAESLPCFSLCGYLVNRKQATKSKVSLLNYSYGLIQRNYVAEKMQEQGRGEPFPKRDFVFCDEAHRVTEIVQSHFAPKFSTAGMSRIRNVQAFQRENGLQYPRYPENELHDLVDEMAFEEDTATLKAILERVYTILQMASKSNSHLREVVKERFEKWEDIPRDWQTAMNNAGFCSDTLCKVEDYLQIIKQSGIESLVKTVKGDEVTFNCLDESYMMQRHFHSQFGFKVFMSATMGNPKHFLQTIGAKGGRYNRLKSTFDFKSSPIYIYRGKRMGRKDIETNLPWAATELEKILKIHGMEKGIVHSGSYHLAKTLHEMLPRDIQKRVLLYDGTGDKMEKLQAFQKSRNCVVMGPSLLEGLDLKGETSRFQIFLKVPYPSLGDKFVKLKMQSQPDWYRWKAEVSIRQGVGRSVRENGDWAKTYILDSCVYDLLRDELSFPEEFRQRIIHIG